MYISMPDNINLFLKCIIRKKDFYSDGKTSNFCAVVWHFYYVLITNSKQRQYIYWPWFINSSTIRWSRGRIAPESLPQLFYQAELKIHYHIQNCLRKYNANTDCLLASFPLVPTPNREMALFSSLCSGIKANLFLKWEILFLQYQCITQKYKLLCTESKTKCTCTEASRKEDKLRKCVREIFPKIVDATPNSLFYSF